MKTTSCTEKKYYAFDNAPRCGARTKRNNADPCRSPAVRSKNRCRMHGGSKNSGAQLKNKNAIKHGFTTSEIKDFRKEVKEIINQFKRLADIDTFIL